MITQPLYGNPLAGGGGLAGGGNLVQRPVDENIERQYFYNKDLNKLFNMPMGVRMAAPKGFESVNKNQYEDFASKGATLQGYERFNDAMGGGYNLDLPRLTSGPNSGQVDRNSPEFLYYYGDSQQKPNIGAGILGNMFMGNATLSNLPPNQEIAQQGSEPLATVGPNVGNEIVPYNPDAGPGIGLDGKPLLDGGPSLSPFPGMDSTEVAIAETQTVNPFQEQFTGFQNQLTGFGDQFTSLNDRLTKIEEGISSLLGNRGQGINLGYNPMMNFGMGIGSLFQPLRGFYGN